MSGIHGIDIEQYKLCDTDIISVVSKVSKASEESHSLYRFIISKYETTRVLSTSLNVPEEVVCSQS